MNITPTVVALSGGAVDGGGGEEGMDWYGWLSAAGLEPSLAYDYALLFAHNELGWEDVAQFDHPLLLSLGVTVGKHRLQILRLAHKERRRRAPRPVARLLSAAGRCLRSLAAGVGGAGRKGRPTPAFRGGGGGGQYYWRSAVLKREKKLTLLKQGRLMLTDGGIRIASSPLPPLSSPYSVLSERASPFAYGGGAGEANEERRWDAMFQDLKPT